MTKTWTGIAVTTVFTAYALFAMEWLFFATKPSFMSALSWWPKVAITFLAPLPFVSLALVFVVLCGTIAAFWRARRASRVLILAAHLPAIVLLAMLLILVVDNFTNTVFDVGVQKTPGAWRRLYALLLLVALLFAARWSRSLSAWINMRRTSGGASTLTRVAWALPLLSLLVVGWVSLSSRRSASHDNEALFPETPATRRPNILLISGDGLDATSLSAYGYKRNTTPFLNKLVPQSLFCENAFANSSHTTGSLMSILTGRLPTQTRVVYPPDILTGIESRRHLPGLLKSHGYRTLHVSIRHYSDAYDLNLRDGFDRSTFQTRAALRTDDVLGDEAAYFLSQVVGRVRDRVLHIVGSAPMPASVDEVQFAPGRWGLLPRGRRLMHGDDDRMRELLRFIGESTEPFFAHVHLLATHGPIFPLRAPFFSRDQEQDWEWMRDFYDDAIREFDMQVSMAIDALERAGKLSNTLVVVHSDHGARSDGRKRTPLVFLFPEDEFAGRIEHNTQIVDIAPTILDYMGIAPPGWMVGRSLLRAHPDGEWFTEPRPGRPVFTFACKEEAIQRNVDEKRSVVDPVRIAPPFYSMGRATVIICQRAYTIDLDAGEMRVRDIFGHTSPCDEEDLPSARAAADMILEHLVQNGYDVSSIQRPLVLK